MKRKIIIEIEKNYDGIGLILDIKDPSDPNKTMVLFPLVNYGEIKEYIKDRNCEIICHDKTLKLKLLCDGFHIQKTQTIV